MKVVAFAAAALLAIPATALALAQVTVGNAPMVKQPEWAEGIQIDVHFVRGVISGGYHKHIAEC